MIKRLEQLLYVSRNLLPQGQGCDVVSSLVRVAEQRNSSLAVSGALMFTGAHFAELLEGPPASLDELMISINRDERHRDVLVVQRQLITNRHFEGWSLAYAGPSMFVERHIRKLLPDHTTAHQKVQEENVRALIGLFRSMENAARHKRWRLPTRGRAVLEGASEPQTSLQL